MSETVRDLYVHEVFLQMKKFSAFFLFDSKTPFLPVTAGGEDPLLMFDPAIVSSTPALVPTHIRSLQASSDVTRRQAALCCRIMSSQLDSILFTEGAKLTSKMIS